MSEAHATHTLTTFRPARFDRRHWNCSAATVDDGNEHTLRASVTRTTIKAPVSVSRGWSPPLRLRTSAAAASSHAHHGEPSHDHGGRRGAGGVLRALSCGHGTHKIYILHSDFFATSLHWSALRQRADHESRHYTRRLASYRVWRWDNGVGARGRGRGSPH
jgi:hypothetical protein